MSIATEAACGVRWREGTKQYCATVTPDIKNAFNSARCLKIRQAMFKFGVPGYLRKILFSARYCELSCTRKSYLLFYRKRTAIVGYADDVILVVVAKHISTVERKCCESIQSVQK